MVAEMKLLWLRRIKRRVVSYFTRPHLKLQTVGVLRRIGSDYGNFIILEDFLDAKPIVFSFGIGTDASFDIEMIKRYNAQVYAFDPTPKSIQWVKEQNFPEAFHFYPVGLSNVDGEEDFFLPENPDFVSGSTDAKSSCVDVNKKIKVPMKTINAIIDEINPPKADILKMDIEGSEFKVLEDILDYAGFRQICMEVHYYFYEDGKQKLFDLVDKMNSRGYFLAAKTENMDVFTFVKRTF